MKSERKMLTACAVKRAYHEHVVEQKKLSDVEFWTRCFESAFFHRDRADRTQKKDPIFDLIAVEEDAELQRFPKRARLQNLLLDLAATDGDHELDTGVIAKNSGEVSLIRRLNHHGHVILREKDAAVVYVQNVCPEV
jgi:hypothetical protein